MVIPVGPGATADLLLLTRRADGTTTRRRLMGVRFVPLVRGHAAGG
jgi:protein-L-isoaspartate O-methyltransferase